MQWFGDFILKNYEHCYWHTEFVRSKQIRDNYILSELNYEKNCQSGLLKRLPGCLKLKVTFSGGMWLGKWFRPKEAVFPNTHFRQSQRRTIEITQLGLGNYCQGAESAPNQRERLPGLGIALDKCLLGTPFPFHSEWEGFCDCPAAVHVCAFQVHAGEPGAVKAFVIQLCFWSKRDSYS